MIRFHHRAGACVRSGRQRGQDSQARGRSRGGFSTKIHMKTDKKGHPIGFYLTGGEASDSRNFETLLDIGAPRRSLTQTSGVAPSRNSLTTTLLIRCVPMSHRRRSPARRALRHRCTRLPRQTARSRG